MWELKIVELLLLLARKHILLLRQMWLILRKLVLLKWKIGQGCRLCVQLVLCGDRPSEAIAIFLFAENFGDVFPILEIKLLQHLVLIDNRSVENQEKRLQIRVML